MSTVMIGLFAHIGVVYAQGCGKKRVRCDFPNYRTVSSSTHTVRRPRYVPYRFDGMLWNLPASFTENSGYCGNLNRVLHWCCYIWTSNIPIFKWKIGEIDQPANGFHPTISSAHEIPHGTKRHRNPPKRPQPAINVLQRSTSPCTAGKGWTPFVTLL